MNPELVKMKCPLCEMNIYFEKGMPTSFTTDCSMCGDLLIFADGELKDFHKYMNSKDSRWPIDGKGTNSIEIN